MISHRKLALLHVAKAQLGMEDADYRAILRNVAMVGSARHLTPVGFEAVMRRLQELGFRSTSPLKPLAPRAGMATPAQVQLCFALWREFTAGQGDEQSLSKWLEGRFKVSSIRFVEAALAPKVIAALREMTRRRRGKTAA